MLKQPSLNILLLDREPLIATPGLALEHFSTQWNCFPVLLCWAVSAAILASRSVMSPVLCYSLTRYSVIERNDVNLMRFSFDEPLTVILLFFLCVGFFLFFFLHVACLIIWSGIFMGTEDTGCLLYPAAHISFFSQVWSFPLFQNFSCLPKVVKGPCNIFKVSSQNWDQCFFPGYTRPNCWYEMHPSRYRSSRQTLVWCHLVTLQNLLFHRTVTAEARLRYSISLLY